MIVAVRVRKCSKPRGVPKLSPEAIVWFHQHLHNRVGGVGVALLAAAAILLVVIVLSDDACSGGEFADCRRDSDVAMAVFSCY